MHSAQLNAAVIDTYITAGVGEGRMFGPGASMAGEPTGVSLCESAQGCQRIDPVAARHPAHAGAWYSAACIACCN